MKGIYFEINPPKYAIGQVLNKRTYKLADRRKLIKHN
jgi:hypothetical protein